MRVVSESIERHFVTAAVIMSLLVCALSVIRDGTGIILATRNLLFLIAGISGLLLSGQMDDILRIRLSQKRKRVVRISQNLLFLFSLVAVVFALFQFGALSGLNRWD